MDEYLFIEMAKLKADRARSERSAAFTRLGDHRSGPASAAVAPAPVTRAVIGLAASLAVNLGALGSLQWDLSQLQAPPPGEVLVVQLPQRDDVPVYAQVAPEAGRRDVAL